MNFDKKSYLPRLIDERIEDYLSVFGAISVEGPKWCGKTWTSSNHAKSIIFFDDEETRNKAMLDMDLVLNGNYPLLIDEWHLVPQVWDKVRRKCDEDKKKGKFILTCSTQLTDKNKEKVYHSGAGRIGKIKMYPMSLFESKDSNGEVSLMDMYNGKQKNMNVDIPTLNELANIIIRGGWPDNLDVAKKNVGLVPKSYIDSVLDKDINDDKKRDRNKMLMLLKSLARNESSIVTNETILNDIKNMESRITLVDYLDALKRLHIIENQEAFSSNYRSKERIGKMPKRHLVDPSLSCAVLNLTGEMLLNDLKTFGFMFEALVERDLKIYIEYLGGHLYHFRDNVSGIEADAVLEFANGDYALVEIKLGYNKIEEAKKSLLKLYEKMDKKPKFMCIIVGNYSSVVKDPETGIYIFPITALRP